MNFEQIIDDTTTFFTDTKNLLSNVNYTAVFEVCENFGKNCFDLITTNLSNPIIFTDVQTILFSVILVILSINLLLIGIYWKKYGGVITDRFIRPSKYDSFII